MLPDEEIASVEPFKGVVNIRFRGAVIASSEAALVARSVDGKSLHLVPEDDIIYCCAHCAGQKGATRVADRA